MVIMHKRKHRLMVVGGRPEPFCEAACGDWSPRDKTAIRWRRVTCKRCLKTRKSPQR